MKRVRSLIVMKHMLYVVAANQRTPLFCDGTHQHIHFDGTLMDSRKKYDEEAIRYTGENFVLDDVEHLCVFARFCHSVGTDAWDLVETAISEKEEQLAIKLATECPAGRLVIRDKKQCKQLNQPMNLVLLS